MIGPWPDLAMPVVSLGRIAELRLGKMLQPEPIRPADREVTYIRAGTLSVPSDIAALHTMYASDDEIRHYSVVAGDLVIAEGGDAGKTAFLPAVPTDTIIQNSLHRIRTPNADRRYVRYCLESIYSSGWLEVLCNKSTFVHLTLEKLASLPVPVRVQSEQRTVADFLDAETARIDALIAAKERISRLFLERDSIVLSDCLIPQSVHFSRLSFFASLQTGLTVDGSRDVGAGAVTRPYLRVANVQAGWLDLGQVAYITLPPDLAARSTLRPGDVLMTEGGDLDKLGRGTLWNGQLIGCLHQNHVFAVRPDPDRLDSSYLALLTRTPWARHYFESTGVRTTNLASTNSAKILDMPVPLLPLDQQRSIVRRYQRYATTTNRLIERLNKQIALLRERRQALITAAVTGQLDIPGTAA